MPGNPRGLWSSPLSARWGFAGLLVLGAILRLIGLNRPLGDFDENHALLWFGGLSFHKIATTYFDPSNHIFYTLVQRFMMNLFGAENEIAVRFPSFAAGVASLALTFLLARRLAGSRSVALLALLFAAVNPVHILYSQTARGYSFVILFSTLTVYAVLNIREARRRMLWLSVGILSGWLSVYTLPSNVYFLLGLGAWAAWTTGIRPSGERRPLAKIFLGGGLATGLLCFASYLPVWESLREVVLNHPPVAYSSGFEAARHLLPGIGSLIFPFAPGVFGFLILIGVGFGETRKPDDRWLPVFIFLLPFAGVLLFNIAGYPRNYLFNFPLFMIFLALGTHQAGHRLASILLRPGVGTMAATGLVLLYLAGNLTVLLRDHYPKVAGHDAQAFKQSLKASLGPHDLLCATHPELYLYAVNPYRKNLTAIMKDNRLDGIRLLGSHHRNLNAFQVRGETGTFALLSPFFPGTPNTAVDLSGEKFLLPLTAGPARSLLKEDFETKAPWRPVMGHGRYRESPLPAPSGNGALLLQTDAESDFLVEAPVPGILEVNAPSLVAVMRAEAYLRKQAPTLPFTTLAFEDLSRPGETHLLNLGLLHDGVQAEWMGKNEEPWTLRVFLGVVPPGRYGLKIRMGVARGETVNYDGLRVFIAPLLAVGAPGRNGDIAIGGAGGMKG